MSCLNTVAPSQGRPPLTQRLPTTSARAFLPVVLDFIFKSGKSINPSENIQLSGRVSVWLQTVPIILVDQR
jgi:hypothetical protein